MGLRDVGEKLPPGFRFYPSDEELVCHYLHKKIAKEQLAKGTLVEIDLHVCEPWQLPDVAKLNSSEWYFFSFRDRKYATGYRTNRATTSGYWKATGKDRSVLDPDTRSLVGMRKTLVFYRNRAPNGIKTGWIMHEFRLENPHFPPKEDWVLCRVFYKSRLGAGENSNMPRDHLYIPTCPNLAVYSSPEDNQQQNNTAQFPNNTQNPNNINSPGLPWAMVNHDMNEVGANKTGAPEMTKCELYDEYGMFMLDFDGVPSSMVFEDNGCSVFM